MVYTARLLPFPRGASHICDSRASPEIPGDRGVRQESAHRPSPELAGSELSQSPSCGTSRRLSDVSRLISREGPTSPRTPAYSSTIAAKRTRISASSRASSAVSSTGSPSGVTDFKNIVVFSSLTHVYISPPTSFSKFSLFAIWFYWKVFVAARRVHYWLLVTFRTISVNMRHPGRLLVKRQLCLRVNVTRINSQPLFIGDRIPELTLFLRVWDKTGCGGKLL